MVIRVAVIEDETGLHGYYGKMMEAWGTARNVRIAATFVGSAEEYLFKYDGQNIFDIIFLDICMKDQKVRQECADRVPHGEDGVRV